MNHTNVDPLVDEVRKVRKAICETFDQLISCVTTFSIKSGSSSQYGAFSEASGREEVREDFDGQN